MISNVRNKVMTHDVYGNYKIAFDGLAEIAGEIRENTLLHITCEDETVTGGYLHRRVILAEVAVKVNRDDIFRMELNRKISILSVSAAAKSFFTHLETYDQK